MTIDDAIAAIHVIAGGLVMAQLLHNTLLLERKTSEVDRLRRRIAFYQGDVRDQQAELRAAFERDCG